MARKFEQGDTLLMPRFFWAILLSVGLFPCSVFAQQPILAFPGAEGFGQFTKGGRGGQVIEVMNLNDSGSGSFRACFEASGPRTCVFRVGGTITLETTGNITNPFITIAGQTAPGGGISLRNGPGNEGSTLKIKTHEVIVRHIRVRPGPSAQPSCCVGAITIANLHAPIYNVIIDHVSMSWATDQVMTTWYDTVQDLTIQRSIISEGLHASNHEKGPHSKGWSLGGKERISVVDNLFAHNMERSPLISTSGVVDVVNNVIYNPGFPIMVYDTGPDINIINNYLKYGINTPSYRYEIRSWDVYSKGARIYVEGNIGPHRPNDSLPNDAMVHSDAKKYLASTSAGLGNYTIVSAADAYTDVLGDVGATMPSLDSVDLRIINEVKDGTGKIINDTSEVGGWPFLSAGSAPQDSDQDGMPDSWELEKGFNPNNGSDGSQDVNGDGYTNLEDYLNGLASGEEETGSTSPQPPTGLTFTN